jgi:hypothetical protein
MRLSRARQTHEHAALAKDHEQAAVAEYRLRSHVVSRPHSSDLSCTGLVPWCGDGGESVEQGAGLGGDLWGGGDGVPADVDVDGP